MAFPASTGRLAEQLGALIDIMRQTKRDAERAEAALASNVTADFVLGMHNRLKVRDSQLGAFTSLGAEFRQYAKDQLGDQSLDVVAEFQAVRAALQAAVAEIETTLPKQGNFLLTHTFETAGYTPRTFTPAQTTTLRTRMAALVGAIS